jgi:hypothetical protein
MSRRVLRVAVVVSFAVVVFAPGAPRAEEAAEKGLGALAWLEGSWEGTSSDGTWETSYTSPRGGSMLSSTKLTRDGKELSYDFERWREEGGAVVMTPFPGGRRSVDFRAVELDAKARRVVLENPEHDFPRRFTYVASGKDELAITLEGEEGGKPMKITLDLARRKTP